jgi:sec-independent protein translocase protein TatC
MPRNRDLFDDSTMTFGEHLEVLRVHVWRALLGIILGVVLALYFGDKIIDFLRTPIDNALRENNLPTVENDLGGMDFSGFIKQLFSGEEKKEPEEPVVVEDSLAEDEMVVQVPVNSLRDAIESAIPGTLKQPAADVKPGADAAAPLTVPLIIKSAEIALFKKTADRFNRPVTYKVEEAFMTYIKVSMVSGFVIASPWVFFQLWLFVAAGLFPHERKYVYTYLPMSLGLFLAGALFCFYFVFPIVLDFLIGFNNWIGVELQPRLSDYISFVLMLPVMFGISFQLPMIMLFLERIGMITVQAYIDNWRMAVLVIAIASMLLTPSDPQSMLLMMFPLIFLYMAGIQLCRLQSRATADPLA